MPVHVELLDNEPILICRYEGKLTTEDLRHIERESLALTESMDGPIPRISDTREASLSFGDLVVLLFDAARARNIPGSTGDPKFADIAVVKEGSIAALGARSMGQDQYGNLRIPVYETMEEALAHARGDGQVDP